MMRRDEDDEIRLGEVFSEPDYIYTRTYDDNTCVSLHITRTHVRSSWGT